MKLPILSVVFAASAAATQTPTVSRMPAAEDLKMLSLEELSRIEVVSLSKELSPFFRSPAALYVLTRETISRSSATNVPDLLRLVPGVEVSQIDSAKWAVGIRGFQGRLSKSVLVMIDGRSVYTPLFAGVYWEMQDVMLEDVDRIEVIRGPGGTIWGANAVNGVINIITRRAQDTRGTLVSGGGGTIEQGFLGVRQGGGTPDFAWRVWGKGFTRGPQFHRDGRNFDDWRRAQGGFRLDWNAGQHDRLVFIGGAYNSEVGSRLNFSTFSPPALVDLRTNGGFSGEHLQGAWRRTFSGGSDVQVLGYYDRTDRSDLNYREVRHTADLDFIHHAALGRHDLIWGGGIRISPSTFTQTVPSLQFLPERETYSIYSGFVQDTITLAPDRFSLTLGSKFEHNSYSAFEYQPSGRIAWTPTDRHTVWGAVTRAVRTPSRIEEGFRFSALANPTIPLYLRLIGDGQFTPEQMVGYELGYRRQFKSTLYFSVAAFYNNYDDLLSVENRPLEPETTPPPTHLILPIYFRNGITAITRGIEFDGAWDARRWLRLGGNYSYINLTAGRAPGSNDASTVAQLEGESLSSKVVVQAWITLGRGWEANLTYRYAGALPGPQQRLPSYSTGDVRLAKRITPDLEFSINGQNLLQPRHAEYAGNPGGPVGIRRSGYVQFTWTR